MLILIYQNQTVSQKGKWSFFSQKMGNKDCWCDQSADLAVSLIPAWDAVSWDTPCRWPRKNKPVVLHAPFFLLSRGLHSAWQGLGCPESSCTTGYMVRPLRTKETKAEGASWGVGLQLRLYWGLCSGICCRAPILWLLLSPTITFSQNYSIQVF